MTPSSAAATTNEGRDRGAFKVACVVVAVGAIVAVVALATGAVASTVGVRPSDIDRPLPTPVREAVRWSWSIFALIGAVTTHGAHTMARDLRPHVEVVGCGVAGLQAVRSLRRATADVI